MPYPSCHTSSPDTFPGGRRSWRTGNRVPEPGHSAEPSNHHCERWSRRRAGHFGSGHSTDHWPATDENWGWHRQTDKSREYDLSCCGSGYQRQTDITCTQITKYYGYNRCSRFHSLLAGLLPPYTWLLSLVLYSTYWQIEKKKKPQIAASQLIRQAKRNNKKPDHVQPILQSIHWLPIRVWVQYNISRVCFSVM